LHASLNTTREIKSRRRWETNVESMGEMRNVYKILVGKPEGKKASVRPRDRWEENIRTDLKEIGCKGVDWIHLAQDQESVTGWCEHGNDPFGSI
jgi:hypothetical protein